MYSIIKLYNARICVEIAFLVAIHHYLIGRKLKKMPSTPNY